MDKTAFVTGGSAAPDFRYIAGALENRQKGGERKCGVARRRQAAFGRRTLPILKRVGYIADFRKNHTETIEKGLKHS